MTPTDTRTAGPDKKKTDQVFAAPGRSGTQPEGRTHRMNHPTSTTTPKPLVVAPVATPKALNYLRNDGLVDIYGYCAPWCFYPIEIGEANRGNAVKDHGLMCHRTVGYVEAQEIDGSEARLGLSLSRPYMHGTYQRGEGAGGVRHYIELQLRKDDEDLCRAFVDVGQARRMIAILQLAVDELDDLRKPLSAEEVAR